MIDKQILLISDIQNTQRTVWRIFILTLRCKELIAWLDKCCTNEVFSHYGLRLHLDTGLASSKNMTKTKTNNKKEKGETVREDNSFTCQQSLGAKMEKKDKHEMTKAKQGNNGFSATVQNLTEDQTSHIQPDHICSPGHGGNMQNSNGDSPTKCGQAIFNRMG